MVTLDPWIQLQTWEESSITTRKLASTIISQLLTKNESQCKMTFTSLQSARRQATNKGTISTQSQAPSKSLSFRTTLVALKRLYFWNLGWTRKAKARRLMRIWVQKLEKSRITLNFWALQKWRSKRCTNHDLKSLSSSKEKRITSCRQPCSQTSISSKNVRDLTC